MPTITRLDDLTRLSQQELDDLFRASPAGPIPDGEADGIAIVAPGGELSEIAAKVVNLIAWQGKVFDSASGTLRNRILPLGIHAIAAKVFKEASWFDKQECIVLDYSHTSLLAQKIRDEIRLVAPNVYLGIVYWGDDKTVNFALDFGKKHPNAFVRFGRWLRSILPGGRTAA